MAEITQTPSPKFQVKTERHPDLPPPASTVGAIGWMRQNLFATWYDALGTVLVAGLLIWLLPPVLNWAFIDATWTGASRQDCLDEAGLLHGACWPFIGARFNQFMFGFYPPEEQWRAMLGFVLAYGSLVPALAETTRMRAIGILGLPVVFFIIADLSSASFVTIAVSLVVYLAVLSPAFVPQIKMTVWHAVIGIPVFLWLIISLWAGSDLFGLVGVETTQWGGLFLTLVLASVAIGVSLPLGIMFALGRRSKMPAIRIICVGFIELFRAVPLISVLFMASVMLPLFLPEGVTFDKVVRAMVGMSLFSAAYMAEVVRGGLQAIPKGQYEAASALGLNYWKSMYLIVLPQALKIVIPGIVNTFIGLFKDTTLVLVIGLLDLLSIIQVATTDSRWLGLAHEGYLFAALVYVIFCFSMSRYSIFLEKKLHTGHKR